MKRLLELVSTINKHKVKQLDVIGLSNDTSYPQQLYNILAANKAETDNEAAKLLLGMSARHSKYKGIKRKLTLRLTNTIFFIDVKKALYSDYQSAYYNCWKNLAAAKILIGKSANFSGNALLVETLQVAEKYEFTELLLHIARQLRSHYGSLEGNLRLFNKYDQIYKKYDDVFRAENQMNEYYIRLLLEYINHRSNEDDLRIEASKYVKEVTTVLDTYDSRNVHLYGRLIQLMAISSTEEKERYMEICNDAVAFFEKKPNVSKTPIHVFLQNKIVLCIEYLDYGNGFAAIELALENADEGTYNWFLDHYYLVMLCMRCGHYNEAYQAYRKATIHKQFKFQTQQMKEGLKLAEAYLFYLKAVGQLEEQAMDSTSFKLKNFLKAVPTYAKDKKGTNIPILIIQILFLIEQKRYDEVEDRVEVIQRYGDRYLKRNDMLRSNCFMRMLAKISISRFHREASIRNTSNLRERLQKAPIEELGQNYAVEIVPYEKLWEMAIDTLENKVY